MLWFLPTELATPSPIQIAPNFASFIIPTNLSKISLVIPISSSAESSIFLPLSAALVTAISS